MLVYVHHSYNWRSTNVVGNINTVTTLVYLLDNIGAELVKLVFIRGLEGVNMIIDTPARLTPVQSVLPSTPPPSLPPPIYPQLTVTGQL